METLQWIFIEALSLLESYNRLFLITISYLIIFFIVFMEDKFEKLSLIS